MPSEWRGRLNEAATADAVVAVCNDYLAAWSPEGLTRLPKDFVPARLADVEDVSKYALQLLQRQLAAEPGFVEIQEMAEFFVAASQRLSQVLAQVPRAPD